MNIAGPRQSSASRSAGLTDREIHDCVLIAAAFCRCNRYVDGSRTSGIDTAHTTCPSVSAPAWSLATGTTTLNATATDNAGNVSTLSGSYTVTVTAASLKAITIAFSTNGGVSNGLVAKIDAASNANTPQARAGQLNAYVNQVKAQTGKAFTSAQADILIRLVGAFGEGPGPVQDELVGGGRGRGPRPLVFQLNAFQRAGTLGGSPPVGTCGPAGRRVVRSAGPYRATAVRQ